MPEGSDYERGYAEGRQMGFLEGHRAGFFEGHRAGWEQGLRDAAAGPQPAQPQPVQPQSTQPSRAQPWSAQPEPAQLWPAQPQPAQLWPAHPQPPVQPLAGMPVTARASAPAVAPRGSELPPSRHAVPGPPLAPPRSRPVGVRSDRESDAQRKARRVVQNANIALYAAALLIVAAAALFLASSTADSVRLGGLIAITGLFYGAGLAVHARVPRLRPAAVALTGTGLALLPVAGLAVDVIAVHRPPVTWLVTSVVGLVAFGAAAVRLESRLLVYLSLTFAFSAAWSGATALGGALAADFAAMLGLSAVLGAATVLRPRWIPPLVLRPIARLHPYVAPATFVAATFAAGILDRWEYPLLVGALCFYFGVSAFVRGPLVLRRASWWAARTTAAIAAGTAAAQAADLGAFGGRVVDFDAGLVVAIATTAATIVAVGLLEERLSAALSLSSARLLAEQVVAVGVQFALLAVLLAGASLRVADEGAIVLAFAAVAASAQFVAWWHGRAAEFLPVAAFAALAIVHGFVTSAQFATLAVWAVAYWLIRAVSAGRGPTSIPDGTAGLRVGWTRAQLVAAARYASLVGVPAVVEALLPAEASTDRAAALAAAVAMAASAQLAVTALVAVLGRQEFARDWLVSTMATAAAVASGVVCFAEPRTQSALHLAVVTVVCVAAVAVWAALFPRLVPRAAGALGQRAGAGEAVPPVLVALIAAGALAADRWGAGNAALALTAAMLAGGATWSAGPTRRWVYVWLARAAATMLAVTLFDALTRDRWEFAVFGQPVASLHVLVGVLLLQLAIPLVVGARRTGPFRWALEDAAVVLGGTALAAFALWPASAYASPGGTGPGPLTATLVVGLAAASALSGALLRGRVEALWLAWAGMVAAALLSGGDARVLEFVVGIAAAHSAIMVWLAAGAAARGLHLVAARALPLLLMALVVRDATASTSAVSVALALGLAAQHAVRRALRGRAAGLPFEQASYWSGLAAQLVLPIVYAATSAGEPGGGRWVLLVEAALALASVLATVRRHPPAGHLGVLAALLGFAWAGPGVRFPAGQAFAAPLLSGAALAVVFAVLAIAQAAGLARWEGRSAPDGPVRSGPAVLPWAWTSGGAVFAVSAAVAGLGEEPWVFGLALAACSTVLLVASWSWRGLAGPAAATFPLGCVAALAAGTALGHSVFAREPFPWNEAMPALVGGLVPAGVGVGLRWMAVRADDGAPLAESLRSLAVEPVRRWSVAGAAGLALLLAARAVWEPPAAVVLPVLAAALAALVVAELPPRARRLGAELGAVLVTAALERAVFAGHGDVSVFWLAQWYVVLGAVLAALRYSAGQRRPGRVWLAAAAGLVSLSGLAAAVGADAPQQVWLLVAFAVLTAGGLVVGERAFTVWGAVGVIACVLWAVRAYPYLLLGVLGLALIGAAVWWLVRTPRGTLLP